MPRRWFASGGLVLLGLTLGTGTFAEDHAKVGTGATIKARNAEILKKLEKPIPLKVKNLPLEEVLRNVEKAIAEPDNTGVLIDVEPGALERAQVLITTSVTYESKSGEPLKDSLAVVLGRLGLRFRVEEGLLRISWRRYRLLNRDLQTKFILDKLEEKVDLTFENASLDDVLKHIKKATSKGPDGNGIPIFVDPVGLLEAETTLATPISFATKGEPLKSSLARLLKSIGLTYVVKDGLLTVTTPD